MSDDVNARIVVTEDGELVLVDPFAAGVIRAVETENVRRSLGDIHRERIAHFATRISELGHAAGDVVIVIINVDMPFGAALADVLMPGTDWAPMRAGGMTPYARGLAMRAGIVDAASVVDPAVGAKLAAIHGVAVFAVDRGVVAAFALEEIAR